MPRKLLQWLGVAFVLVLVAAAGGGLLVLKDRIRVVVQDDVAEAGPEPVALLRDDVQVVARDLAELRQALGTNFERLGEALEQRAEQRHGDVLAVQRELAAVPARLQAEAAGIARLQERLQAVEAKIDGLGQAIAAGAAASSAPVAVPTPAAVEVPAVVETPPAPAVQATDAPPPAVPEAKPSAKPAGFLSFSVPSVAFRFDALQDYVLVPELSRVGFDAKSTLHDFSGVTSKVAGTFAADFDDPQGAWRGEVHCEAGTLLTGVDGRDSNMWEHLDTKQHPQIRFHIEGFTPAPNGVDTDKQTVRGEVRGRMTIRGQTRELRMPVEVAVDASRRVVVKGQTPLKLSDFGVPVPSQLGVINMQDEVVVWVALRARVAPGGRK